jgi:hypothetical protein
MKQVFIRYKISITTLWLRFLVVYCSVQMKRLANKRTTAHGTACPEKAVAV